MTDVRMDQNGNLVPLTDAEIAQRQADAAMPPLPKYLISKVEMWRRCTDDEAEALYADLRQAPVRLQALFDGAQIVDTRDELYMTLKGIVEARVGADRAAVILAPTS